MKHPYPAVAVSLGISLFIYVFYRSEHTVVNELLLTWLPYEHFVSWRSFWREHIPLTGPLVYSLPGGLWVLAATLLARGLCFRIGRVRMPCVYGPVLFALGIECAQYLHLTNGTFDPVDVGFSLAFGLAGLYPFRQAFTLQETEYRLGWRSLTLWGGFAVVYLSDV